MIACKKNNILCFVSLLLIIAACTREQQQKPIEVPGNIVRGQSTPAFTLPSEFASLKTDIRRADMNHDGFDDAIVITYSAQNYESSLGFDSLFVYEYAPDSSKFHQKFRHAYYYGSQLEVKDLNNDGFPEVCIFLDGGGNSDIASRGLTLVGLQNRKYKETLILDSGAPQITTISADSALAVVVFNEYWPEELSHAETVSFLDSVIVLSQKYEQKKDSVIRALFVAELAKTEKEYNTLRDEFKKNHDDDSVFQIYGAAVRLLTYYRKTGQMREAMQFRDREQKFLRDALPSDYFSAFNSLVKNPL